MQYIDSALESALIVLFEMASSNKDLWISDLRNLICTSFGRGWRVNGEQSGRTKLIYVFNEGKGENNPRTTATLNIEWKQANILFYKLWKFDLDININLRENYYLFVCIFSFSSMISGLIWQNKKYYWKTT